VATISITKTHHLPHKKAKEVAQKIARDLESRFDLAHEWDGDAVVFHRPGVSGRLHVGKDRLTLHAELGFLLGALKPVIEKEIHTQFEKLVVATPKKKKT
jgi:putative polyhydroxyalkanoate system protein